MGVWWCSQAALDLSALTAARAMRHGLFSALPSAERVQVVAGVGGFVLSACFVGHLLWATRDRTRVVAWALLPLLVLSASPVFAPDPRLGNPDTLCALAVATLEGERFEPLYRPAAFGEATDPSGHRASHAIALLSHNSVMLIHGGRSMRLEFGDIWGDGGDLVTLVPDAGATVGDLRRAVRHFPFVGLLQVAWKDNWLSELPKELRWRWPFVERASRDLRARPVHLVDPDLMHCDRPPPFTASDATTAPGAMRIGDYLDRHDRDFVFVVSGFEDSRGRRVRAVAELPRDAMDAHLLPLDSPWPPLLGALLALAAFGLVLLRDLVAATLIRRALVAVSLGTKTEMHPPWVPIELGDSYAVGDGDPYRRAPRVVGVSSRRVVLATLAERLLRAAPRAFAAIASWLLLAILAYALWL